MLQLDEVGYSESATVTVIIDFFNFLTKMYLDDATVEWPPEGGWPMITADTFRGLNKSERVISLLRKLPYLQDFNGWHLERPQVAPRAVFCNWKDFAKNNEHFDPEKADEMKLLTEGFVWERTSPDVIGLLEGGRDSPLILLDTKHGIVYWPECDSWIRNETRQEQVQDDSEAWDTPEEADWRGDAPAWTITDFFAMLREQFEQLGFIPVNSRMVTDSHFDYTGEGDLEPTLQETYRNHGWPSLEQYRKEECIQALRQVVDEKCPDFPW